MHTKAYTPRRVINTLGAGDVAAGCVLYGLAHDIAPKYFMPAACYKAARVLEVSCARLRE